MKDNVKINSFSEVDSYSLSEQLTNKIKDEIYNKEKEYILGVDEKEFTSYLIKKYSLEPLAIDLSNESIEEPIITKEWVNNRLQRARHQIELYEFKLTYKYSGSSVIFKIRPDSYMMAFTEIYLNESQNNVYFKFKISQPNPVIFKREKDDIFGRAFGNLENANEVARNWNNQVPRIVLMNFQDRKSKYLKENEFFTAINVKINKSTSDVFPTPTIKKKLIPQPIIPKNKEVASEPFISMSIYEDILKVIYDSGKNMEKKPALYKNKEEEDLRDQFLFVLETRYEGTTATGETFNRSGRSDIILKFSNDSSNLFVAECKFWHGPSEFLNAISQLFDRYLTWRDSKVALLLFVKNKDFTNVLDSIRSNIRAHPYFIKEDGNRGESSFSYIFHLPQDKNKEVIFEVIAFHYDK